MDSSAGCWSGHEQKHSARNELDDGRLDREKVHNTFGRKVAPADQLESQLSIVFFFNISEEIDPGQWFIFNSFENGLHMDA